MKHLILFSLFLVSSLYGSEYEKIKADYGTPNGEILIYDSTGNIFGVFTNKGVPKTMFKPKNGLIYWEGK